MYFLKEAIWRLFHQNKWFNQGGKEDAKYKKWKILRREQIGSFRMTTVQQAQRAASPNQVIWSGSERLRVPGKTSLGKKMQLNRFLDMGGLVENTAQKDFC